MNGITSRAALLPVLLALLTPTMAQDALDRRVTLDLKAMAPREAFGVIATAIGYSVEVAPQVSTPVDIVVRNITARTALSTICESIGCAWQASGTAIRVRDVGAGEKVPQGPRGSSRVNSAGPADQRTRTSLQADLVRRLHQPLPVDMKFEHAPLAHVAERLSKATGFVVTFTGATSPEETFSADLGGQTFSSALGTIAKQTNGHLVCRVEMPREGAGPMVAAIALRLGSARK